MTSSHDTKTYCRQTLIGGNYGLLNTTKFVPNPDFYRKGKFAMHNFDRSMREEYHLTPKDGDIHSQIMLLNGNILSVDSYGTIPPLEPIRVNRSDPITVAPFSVVFADIPNILVPACD